MSCVRPALRQAECLPYGYLKRKLVPLGRILPYGYS